MAQIPVFNGRQILEPGSPVQVAGAEGVAGAMQGNAMEGLGRAIEGLGNLHQKVKEESDRYLMKSLAEDASMIILKAKAEADAEGLNPNDTTGFMAVQAFTEKVDERVNEMFKNSVPEDATKQNELRYYIKNERNKTAAQVLAGRVKRIEESLPIHRQATVATRASVVRADPSQFNLKQEEIVASFAQDKSIPDAAFEAHLHNANIELSKAAVNGFSDRISKSGRKEDLDAGIEFINTKLNSFLSPDEAAKQKDILQRDFIQYQDREMKMMDRDYRDKERFKQAQEDAAVAEVSSTLATVGNDYEKQLAARIQIMNDPRLTDPKRTALMSSLDQRAKWGDDATEGLFLNKVFRKERPEKLKAFVDGQWLGGHLSTPKRNDLIEKINQFTDEAKVPSYLKDVMSAHEQTLQAMAQDNYDLTSKEYSQQKIRAEKAALMYSQRVAAYVGKNGSIDEKTLNGIYSSVLSGYLKISNGGRQFDPIKGVSQHEVASSKIANDTLQRSAKDAKKNWNSWTPTQQRDYLNKIKGLGNRVKDLQQEEGTRTSTPSSTNRQRPFDE